MVWTPLSDTYFQIEAAPGKVVSDIAISEEVKALNQMTALLKFNADINVRFT